MGYDGIVLGEEELGLGVDFIVGRAHELRLPVVVANLWDASADTLLFDPSRRIVLHSGLRVGIIGVMSDRLRLPPQARGKVRLSSALEAARRQATAMRDSVDVVLLLAHADRTQARIYAQEIGALDVIVHGSEGRAMRRVRPHNNAYILQVGSKGRYMGVAHAVLGENGRISSLVSAVTPLSMVYEDDAAIAKLFAAYDLDIAAKEKTNIPAGVFATRQGVSDPYAGADACQKCHPQIHAQWQENPHAHAFARLQEQSRHFDRDCTPCHTTGFYERGGFETFAVTPDLANVQCEACHGNGHAHVADPTRKTPGDARGVCRSCHTVEQTPEFEFDAFWGRIEHKKGG
jgi:hypothetical protein